MKTFLAWLFSAALCCSMGGALAADPSTSVWNPDDTAPTFNDVVSAAAHARALHCGAPSCRAIIAIQEMVEIARYEDGDANGLASIRASGRPERAGRRLDRALLNHPELYEPVCATGAKLISRFKLGPGVHEMYVPVQLLMNGVEIDLHDHGHCTQDLLAALPKDPANDEVRLNANSLCVNGYENHARPKAACDVLIRGLEPGR